MAAKSRSTRRKVTRSGPRGRVKKTHASTCVPPSSHKAAYKSVRFPFLATVPRIPLLSSSAASSLLTGDVRLIESLIDRSLRARNRGCLVSARIFALRKSSLILDPFFHFYHLGTFLYCVKWDTLYMYIYRVPHLTQYQNVPNTFIFIIEVHFYIVSNGTPCICINIIYRVSYLTQYKNVPK